MATLLCEPAVAVVLPNPADGTDVWYHGTPYDFASFDVVDDGDSFDDCSEQTDRHWNSHLGTHWTSMASVAATFAAGRWTNQYASPGRGFVFHAQLRLANPARFLSEFDLDAAVFDAAWSWADAHDPMSVHDEVCDELADGCTALDEHRTGSAVDVYVRRFYARREQSAYWLTSHRDADRIADRFRDQLVDAGFDGVVYGNEIEGPTGHTCAISFDVDQIAVVARSAR